MAPSAPKTSGPTKTVAVISLGCPKNTVDSEVMLGKLAQDHYSLVKDPAQAEVVIVNTCGFIEASKKESIDTILGVAKLRKTGKLKSLVVGGCLAHRYGDELKKELPEIDILFGLNDVEDVSRQIAGKSKTTVDAPKPMLPESLSEATYVYDASSPRLLSTPGHFAYVKISEGCDLPCTFCIIPKIRGHYRSRSIEDIEQEAGNLASQGIREICLVAQDSTWYGADRYGKPKIAQLLEKLAGVKGLDWVRLHYLYPSRVTDEMLDVMAAHGNIAPYFDVPLQHASDRILKSMQRIGDRALLERMLDRIRQRVPKASLRSTFIVGFPGETGEDFDQLMDFLKKAQLDYAGFFAYSQEENTPAGIMPGQVTEGIKKARLAEAYRLQESIAEKAHGKWVGEKLLAVVESVGADGEVQGRTKYQAPEVDGVVLIEGLKAPEPGQWVEVEITHTLNQDLVARAV
ncbi:MAG TPA: 30S ribosomal protein S12 methylthiotransferase RimO [bacterium]|nr:30S ribosomal protein S12 methylthiotransferase RimO [bacterium]